MNYKFYELGGFISILHMLYMSPLIARTLQNISEADLPGQHYFWSVYFEIGK